VLFTLGILLHSNFKYFNILAEQAALFNGIVLPPYFWVTLHIMVLQVSIFEGLKINIDTINHKESLTDIN